MRALLVVAHGSRRAESNDEVRALTRQIRELKTGDYEYIDCAFLELAEPSIPDGIRQCLDRGVNEVTVLPYFLSAGRHVNEDIPELVKAARAEYPGAKLTLAPHLGTASSLAQLMLDLTEY